MREQQEHTALKQQQRQPTPKYQVIATNKQLNWRMLWQWMRKNVELGFAASKILAQHSLITDFSKTKSNSTINEILIRCIIFCLIFTLLKSLK